MKTRKATVKVPEIEPHVIENEDKTTLQILYVTAQWKLVLYKLNSNNFSSLLQRVDAPHLLRYIQSL